MIFSKKQILQSIFTSADGVHLSAYLENQGSWLELKERIEQTASEASDWVDGILKGEEKKKFLEPLKSLALQTNLFKHISGDLGIFRNRNTFRVLNLPVSIVNQVHVASSFHIKPLLRWLQLDQEFFLVGIKSDSVHLYYGQQTSIKKLDILVLDCSSAIKEKSSTNANRVDRAERRTATSLQIRQWLAEWIRQSDNGQKARVFFVGEAAVTKSLMASVPSNGMGSALVEESFIESQVPAYRARIHRVLRSEIEKAVQSSLFDFRLAEEMNLAERNLLRIAQEAIRGRVSKLIIADGIHVYGKLDQSSGGVVIHPYDLDHEDDDILDDLAQTVLAKGGEVVVIPRDEIPKGRPALAILKDTNEIEKVQLSSIKKEVGK